MHVLIQKPKQAEAAKVTQNVGSVQLTSSITKGKQSYADVHVGIFIEQTYLPGSNFILFFIYYFTCPSKHRSFTFVNEYYALMDKRLCTITFIWLIIYCILKSSLLNSLSKGSNIVTYIVIAFLWAALFTTFNFIFFSFFPFHWASHANGIQPVY